MVKSTFKKSGIFRLIVAIVLLVIAVVLTLVLSAAVFFGSSIIKTADSDKWFLSAYIVFFYIMIAASIKSVYDRAYIIQINTETQTMYFKHIFTFQRKTYQFADIDSYIDIHRSGKAGSWREAYLLRNGKAEKIICGLYYANMDELISALHPIQYDGFKTINARIIRQSLLNSQIKID